MRRLALAVLLGTLLALPATASAHKPRLTIKHAEAIIIRTIGPGTTITGCGRLSHGRVDCGYSTPALNVGIETENPGARFYSSMVV